MVPAEPAASVTGRAWGGDNKVTFASITDGTSNTILVGEKWLRPDQYVAQVNGVCRPVSKPEEDFGRVFSAAP